MKEFSLCLLAKKKKKISQCCEIIWSNNQHDLFLLCSVKMSAMSKMTGILYRHERSAAARSPSLLLIFGIGNKVLAGWEVMVDGSLIRCQCHNTGVFVEFCLKQVPQSLSFLWKLHGNALPALWANHSLQSESLSNQRIGRKENILRVAIKWKKGNVHWVRERGRWSGWKGEGTLMNLVFEDVFSYGNYQVLSVAWTSCFCVDCSGLLLCQHCHVAAVPSVQDWLQDHRRCCIYPIIIPIIK